jgi:hypothetical protein
MDSSRQPWIASLEPVGTGLRIARRVSLAWTTQGQKVAEDEERFLTKSFRFCHKFQHQREPKQRQTDLMEG